MRPDSGIEWKTAKNTYLNIIKFYSLEMCCINEIDNKFIFKSIKSNQKQILLFTNNFFVQSTLHDVFVYKAEAFTYLFRT